MALTVHFQDGPLAGQPLFFEDKFERVRIGRDSERCQIVLPADQVVVGGEHCSIVRQDGNVYEVWPTPNHRLLINGKEVADCLPFRFEHSVRLQLGCGGPQLLADVGRTTRLPPTIGKVDLPGERELLEKERARRRQAIFGAGCFAVGLVLILAVVWRSFDHRMAALERETVDLKSLTGQELALLRAVQAASGRVDRTTEEQFDKSLQRANAPCIWSSRSRLTITSSRLLRPGSSIVIAAAWRPTRTLPNWFIPLATTNISKFAA